MYTDVSVHHEDGSGWCVSTRIRSKIVSEQSGAYTCTKSNMRVEIAAIIVALIWYHVPMSPEQSNCLIPSYFCVKSKMDMNGIVPAFKVLCEYTV